MLHALFTALELDQFVLVVHKYILGYFVYLRFYIAKSSHLLGGRRPAEEDVDALLLLAEIEIRLLGMVLNSVFLFVSIVLIIGFSRRTNQLLLRINLFLHDVEYSEVRGLNIQREEVGKRGLLLLDLSHTLLFLLPLSRGHPVLLHMPWAQIRQILSWLLEPAVVRIVDARTSIFLFNIYFAICTVERLEVLY